MADIVDQKTRSRMMAGIKGKNTKPEMTLRRALHARGFRYRLHATELTGKPDIILSKYRALIFVHGCFWHRHNGCRYATIPATRSDFWQAKFAANVSRDSEIHSALTRKGWRVAIIWECALRNRGSVAMAVRQIEDWLRTGGANCEIGEFDLQTDRGHSP